MIRRTVPAVLVALVGMACAGAPLSPATTAPAPPPTTIGSTSTAPPPTTTVTAPSLTSEATAPGPAGMVGYVGCSVIHNAVDGYHRVGGEGLWPAQGVPYGGGAVGKWADRLGPDSIFWAAFTDLLASHPGTSAMWWGLCTIKNRDTYEQARIVLDEIERLAPGLPVYASAQPRYEEGHVCDISGPGGPERMDEVVDRLIAEDLVLPGPRLGPLSAEQTQDGCHANDDGRELMGDQLVAFFGG